MEHRHTAFAHELVARLQATRGLLAGVETAPLRNALIKAPRSFFLPDPSEEDIEMGYDPSLVGPLRVGNFHHSAPDLYVTALLHLDIKEGTSFLNIGSGTGWLSCLVAILQKWRGINHGVEVLSDLCDFSVDKIDQIANIDGVTNSVMIVNANFMDLDQENNIKYDAIYFSRNCPNEEVLLKTRALLNPGGRMVVPYNGIFLCIYQDGRREPITSVIFGNLKMHYGRGDRFTIVHRHDLSEIDIKSADGESPIIVENPLSMSSRGKVMFATKEFADVEFVFTNAGSTEEIDYHYLFSSYSQAFSSSDEGSISSEEDGNSTRILAHRCILAPASSFFSGLFSRGFAESCVNELTGRCVVRIHDCPAVLFSQMLEYIYTGQLSVSPVNMVYLMKVADQYGIYDLLELCEKTLTERCVTLNSVCALLQVAHSLNASTLVDTCLGVIARQADKIFVSDDILSLSKPLLKMILGRDDLNCPEIYIWNLVMKWSNAQFQPGDLRVKNPKNILEVADGLLELVRISQMSAKEVIYDVGPTGLFHKRELAAILKLIEKGSNNTQSRRSSVSASTAEVEDEATPMNEEDLRYTKWISCPRVGSNGVKIDLRNSGDKVKRPRCL